MSFRKILFPLVACSIAAGATLAADPQPLALQRALDAAGTASTTPAEREASRMEVTRHFFDALVADSEYAAANEQVAVTYVAFDRARTNAGPAWQADAAVKELEVRYAKALERRMDSLHRQRLSRHALAGAMRSSSVPGELDDPEEPDARRPMPEYESLEKTMFERNSAWRAASQGRERDRIQLREEMRADLLRTVLEIELLTRAVRPRADREAELADLRLEMAREDLEQGRPGGLGAAMAGTAEAAYRRIKARGALAVALARLEKLVGSPIP